MSAKTDAQHPSSAASLLLLQLGVAGAANCAGAITTNPLDVVKVRQQLRGQRAPHAHEVNWLRWLVHISRTEGFRGIGAGWPPSLLRESTYSAMRLGLYAPFRDALWDKAANSGPLPMYVRFLAGATSGCIGSAIASPADLIKIRAQTASTGATSNAPQGIVAIARSVIANEGGVVALWQGVGANMQRATLLTAAQVGSYDEIKSRIRRGAASIADAAAGRQQQQQQQQMLSRVAGSLRHEGPALHFCAAAAAGLVAALVTTPVDTAKSRLMNQRAVLASVVTAGATAASAAPSSDSASSSSLARPYRGTIDCLLRTARTEGVIGGCYSGFWPTWARLTVHTVVTFTCFESIRKAVGLPPL